MNATAYTCITHGIIQTLMFHRSEAEHLGMMTVEQDGWEERSRLLDFHAKAEDMLNDGREHLQLDEPAAQFLVLVDASGSEIDARLCSHRVSGSVRMDWALGAQGQEVYHRKWIPAGATSKTQQRLSLREEWRWLRAQRLLDWDHETEEFVPRRDRSKQETLI